MTVYWTGSLGAALAAPGDVVLDLGPDHPSRAGAVALRCFESDGVVTECRVEVGWMHRGAEKLLEVRDYRAALSLANRHDWQAPGFGELSLALSVEDALGIVPPIRATWLRTLLVEHCRIHAQLGQLGWLSAGDATRTAREGLRETLASWTGNRLHPMLTRIGGVVADVDAEWLAAERTAADHARAAAEACRPSLDAIPAGLARTDAQTLDAWGLSGPWARAAGLDRDLRRLAPRLAYDELDVPAPVAGQGDARDRLRQAIDDVVVSARLIDQITRRLESLPGPIDTRLPKIIRLPEGSFYAPLEAPWGEAGIRVVSRGEKTAWRMSLRTPSLAGVQALEGLLPGTPVDHVADAVASVGYVIGDVDK